MDKKTKKWVDEQRKLYGVYGQKNMLKIKKERKQIQKTLKERLLGK